jgi:hypothetical protein
MNYDWRKMTALYETVGEKGGGGHIWTKCRKYFLMTVHDIIFTTIGMVLKGHTISHAWNIFEPQK